MTFPKSSFNCYNPKEIRYITHLRLEMIHLRKHKLNYSFQDALNLLYNRGSELEITIHYLQIVIIPLFHCPNFQNKRLKLFSKDKMKKMITRILSYSYLSIDDVIKMYIITRVTEYILATKVSLLIKGRSFGLI